MNHQILRAVLVLLLISSPHMAMAAVAAVPVCNPAGAGMDETKTCVGQPCAAVGTTMIDSSKRYIIACLKSDVAGASPIWKSMSGLSADVTCPTGSVLSGFSASGTPVCKTLTCRHVVADGGAPPWYIGTATCNADEILTGGGGASETPGTTICAGISRSHLHASFPSGNSWIVDAYRSNWAGEACSRAVAVCCKWQ